MAEFAETIASIKEVLSYEEAPVPVAGVLAPYYSHSNQEYSTTSQAWQFSHTLSEPVVIPGSYLTAGKKFLIFYSVAYGGDGPDVIAYFNLVSNLGAADLGIGHGEGLANATAVPKSMRCSSGQSFFVHTGDGTDLEFAYRSVDGGEIFFKGMTLIAVPLDDDTSPLVEGRDYFYTQFNGLVSPYPTVSVNSTEGWKTIVTTGTLAPGAVLGSSAEFIVMACATVMVGKSDVGGVRCGIFVNGMIPDPYPSKVLKMETNRGSTDNRSAYPFTVFSKVNLSENATIQLNVQGACITGDPVVFQTGCVLLLRVGFFDQVVHGEYWKTSPAPIDWNYPMWRYIGESYTPNQEETVLILGNAMVSTVETKSILIRLNNWSNNEPFCDFVSDGNLSTTRRWKSLSVFAVDDVNTETAFDLNFCGEPGMAPTSAQVQYGDLFIISLKPADAIVNQSVIIVDTLSGGENLGGSGPAFSDLTERLAGVESLVTSVGTTEPGTIPDIHPRLWLYNSDRISYLQSLKDAVAAEWTNFINMGASGWTGLEGGGWSYALRYLVDPTNTAARDAALAFAAEQVSLTGVGDIGRVFMYKGLMARDALRSAALIYDWLYDELDDYDPTLKGKLEDFMLGCVYVCLNNRDAISQSIYNTSDWATNNPYQNYYGAFQLGAAYVALVLYHHQPTTWAWPPGDPNRHQFWLPYNTGAYASGTDTRTFTDLWEYVYTRAIEMSFPAWDVECVGGGWHEGSNYGRAMLRHIAEWASIIYSTAGLDWIKTKSWFKEIIKHELYTEMPGRTVMAQFGDYGSGWFNVMAYNRAMMSHLFHQLKNTAEGRYAKYWLDNEVTVSSGDTSSKVWDFFLADNRVTELNYTTVLPIYHYAAGAGYIYSMTAWGATGTVVMFTAHDQRQNHKHRDNCGIHIYKGGISGIGAMVSWPLCDPGAFTTSFSVGNSHYHNTYIIDGQGQRSRTDEDGIDPDSGTIERHFSNSVYSYGQGDMQDGYWIPYSASTSHGDTKMTDEFTREFFHLRALGIVIAFDRISIEASYDINAQIDCLWQFPYDSPVAQGGNIYRHDLGNHRVFYKLFRISPAWSIPFINTLEDLTIEEPSTQPNTWRHDIQLNPSFLGESQRDHQFMTVFELTDNTHANMISVFSIKFVSEALGLTPVNCDGACITPLGGTTTYSVIFATTVDGSAPTIMVYHSQVLATTIHYVCNLDPAKKYSVVNNSNTITITEDAGGNYTPNAGGVIEFDPASLVTPPDEEAEVTDNLYSGDSLTTMIPAQVVVITEGLSGGEVVSAGNIGHIIDGVTLSESISYREHAIPSDTLGLQDSVVVSTATTQVDYAEKTIIDTLSDFLPNEDKGNSFFTPSPNDGVFYNKISDSSDATFVKTEGYGVRYASLYIGMSSPGPYVSRINSFTLSARFKEVVLGNTIGLNFHVTLVSPDLLHTFAAFTIPLTNIVSPKTLTLPTQAIDLGGGEVETMVAIITLSARTWGSPKIELSKLSIAATGDIAEKEI